MGAPQFMIRSVSKSSVDSIDKDMYLSYITMHTARDAAKQFKNLVI